MKVFLQNYLPRVKITYVFGVLGKIRIKWIKNRFIRRFIRKYHIDIAIAERESVDDYENFNDFFVRKLKKQLRPIDTDPTALVSPVDGYIYHFGTLAAEPMFAAKGFEFTLNTLLVKPSYAELFAQGSFLCMYLSPRDYHRVHMPLTGRLLEMSYIPGDYYSVAPEVLSAIPGIFSKNERLICLFETAAGPMAFVMIGAMCVASIYTAWAGCINQRRKGEIIHTDYRQEAIMLQKGDELGYFQMGSTVMAFFPKDSVTFNSNLVSQQHCLFGEKLGTILIS